MKRGVALEDVLDAFSMEEDVSTQTLERYLRVYPQYVEALSDLFHELNLVRFEAEATSDAEVKAAFQDFETDAVGDRGQDEESLFSKDSIKRAAKNLGVSRAFLAGFRDRLVIAATVPPRILKQLAKALGQSEKTLETYLRGEASIGTAVAFKSDGQPRPPDQISFEAYLKSFPDEADQLARLMDSDGRD
ncbi:hypothetical protein [Hyphomonas sp.]|uniref:hypothetical protein n=1 Tax=Hyphomonas sp. TaxID=87 RepID=UPI0025C62BDE|nr:hypothetical protein [Hyphomonas sp.]